MTSLFDEPEVVGDDADTMRRKALEFAQNYAVLFVHNPVGRTLLEHWTATLANKRTPVNAPITEYAANEAVRAFIQGIHDQIKLSQDSAMR
ncbi:MAG: hypothetical protein LLG14_27190 [Nocardiaceae bacterium]|nr:hypothetical protein [Nocardiaceae bacterium]